MITIQPKPIKAIVAKLKPVFNHEVDPFSMAKLTMSGDKLKLEVWDLNCKFEALLEIEENDGFEGEAWLPLKELHKLAVKAKKRLLKISHDENKSIITIGKSSLKFHKPDIGEKFVFGHEYADEPYIGMIEIDGCFISELKASYPYASDDDNRVALEHVFISSDNGNGLRMISTSGHMMYSQLHKGPSSFEAIEEVFGHSSLLSGGVLVEKLYAKLICDLFSPDEDVTVILRKSNNHKILFELEQDGKTISISTEDFTFPDYSKAIASESERIKGLGVMFDKAEVIESMEFAVNALPKSKSLMIDMDCNGMIAKTQNISQEFEAEINGVPHPDSRAVIDGDDPALQFGINHEYLMQVLGTLGEKFDLWASKPMDPLYFIDDKKEDIIVVMPMRLD